MPDLLSQDVEDIIGLSLETAIRLGNDCVGTEHLVLSLISNDENSVVIIFNKLNIDIPELIAMWEPNLQNRKSQPVVTTKSLPLTRMAEKAIRVSVLEAKFFKSSPVEPQHLMLAILKDKSTLATQTLNLFDVDYDLFITELKLLLRPKETYISKVTKIYETESLKPVVQLFEKQERMIICTGAAKIGKTALSLKLIHALAKYQPFTWNCSIISFDETNIYWKNKLQPDEGNEAPGIEIEIGFMILAVSRGEYWLLNMLLAIIDMAMGNHKNNFIVVDGIEKIIQTFTKHDSKRLLNTLTVYLQKRKSTVLFTSRKPIHNMLPLEFVYTFEYWHLDRPGFLNDECKEFGDTKLEVTHL